MDFSQDEKNLLINAFTTAIEKAAADRSITSMLMNLEIKLNRNIELVAGLTKENAQLRYELKKTIGTQNDLEAENFIKDGTNN